MRDEPQDPPSLIAAAAALGVTLDHAQATALLEFSELLRRWNQAFNLVSRHDEGRLLSRHVLDSLSVAPDLDGVEVLDLGTGAGLPGVPLAIARPLLRFTLVDRNARRIRFVERAARALGLGNVAGHGGDVRELPPARRFDTVVARAVADLPTVWDLAGARLEPGGRLVVMHRGRSAHPRAPVPPPGACIDARRVVRIPGLARAYEVVVLTTGDSGRNGAREGS